MDAALNVFMLLLSLAYLMVFIFRCFISRLCRYFVQNEALSLMLFSLIILLSSFSFAFCFCFFLHISRGDNEHECPTRISTSLSLSFWAIPVMGPVSVHAHVPLLRLFQVLSMCCQFVPESPQVMPRPCFCTLLSSARLFPVGYASSVEALRERPWIAP